MVRGESVVRRLKTPWEQFRSGWYDADSTTPRAASCKPATMDGAQQHEFEVDVDRPARGPARAGKRDFGSEGDGSTPRFRS